MSALFAAERAGPYLARLEQSLGNNTGLLSKLVKGLNDTDLQKIGNVSDLLKKTNYHSLQPSEVNTILRADPNAVFETKTVFTKWTGFFVFLAILTLIGAAYGMGMNENNKQSPGFISGAVFLVLSLCIIIFLANPNKSYAFIMISIGLIIASAYAMGMDTVSTDPSFITAAVMMTAGVFILLLAVNHHSFGFIFIPVCIVALIGSAYGIGSSGFSTTAGKAGAAISALSFVLLLIGVYLIGEPHKNAIDNSALREYAGAMSGATKSLIRH